MLYRASHPSPEVDIGRSYHTNLDSVRASAHVREPSPLVIVQRQLPPESSVLDLTWDVLDDINMSGDYGYGMAHESFSEQYDYPGQAIEEIGSDLFIGKWPDKEWVRYKDDKGDTVYTNIGTGNLRDTFLEVVAPCNDKLCNCSTEYANNIRKNILHGTYSDEEFDVGNPYANIVADCITPIQQKSSENHDDAAQLDSMLKQKYNYERDIYMHDGNSLYEDDEEYYMSERRHQRRSRPGYDRKTMAGEVNVEIR